ncbi:MAG: hypothetical protein OXG15_01195 [Gammaproteobacteria bacterium]|nr:hypothetical protein [Gammaproteobacteria bacterium]
MAEQANPPVVANLHVPAEQFIEPWRGQFRVEVPGAMGDDIRTLVIIEPSVYVILVLR